MFVVFSGELIIVIKLMEPKKYTDLVYTKEMSKGDTPSCNHFSLRGYVAEMRHKDPSLCFPVRGSETQPSLPPLVVRKFPSWSCSVCRRENVVNISDESEQRTCCKRVQEPLTHKSVPARKETDTIKVIDLTGSINDRDDSDHTPVNEEEKNDADQISLNEITDLMENDLNLQVSNIVGSSDVCPSLVQETQANETGETKILLYFETGFEGIVVHESEAELVVNDVTTKDKSCSKVADKGKQICEDDQCLQELRKSCTRAGKALKITEKDIVPEHNAEQFPPITGDEVQAGDSEKNEKTENEIQDLHQKKSSKKFKRVRLLREILREDDEPVVEHTRRGRPALQNPSDKSADSQRQKTVMDKVVDEGDTKKYEKKGQPGRKRKLVVDEDEEDESLTDLIQRIGNQVSNEEGLGERQHLSSNSSPQTLLLRSVQEGSGGETDSTGEGIFPLTSAFSTEGKGVHTE
ncbi:hypothetical protein V8G54_035622, partial [Vigna mungo]